MKRISEIENAQIEMLDLDALEEVSGGVFKTPEDQAMAYECVMEPCGPEWEYICQIERYYYETELTRYERELSFDEWLEYLDEYRNHELLVHNTYY